MEGKLKKTITLIESNEPIIIPTDTVYGLVCRYDSRKAVEKIYKLKKRTRKKPLILLGCNWQALKRFVRVINKKELNKLIKQWPGAMTLVLPASKQVPKYLNKGYKTIGIRVPNNKFLLKLLKQCPEQVLASTSANISGESDKIPQKELQKKIKLFMKAKQGEMSFKPSKIIELNKNETIVIR